MSNEEILDSAFENLKICDEDIPDIVSVIADAIPGQKIPYRMRLSIAISEIMLFTSQFRINIEHWNESIIPVNSIMFIIAKSGASKDSSYRAARACFEKGYKIIEKVRIEQAKERAIEEAKRNGDESPEEYRTYKKYFKKPNPLFASISTSEGFTQHLNDLQGDSLGAGFVYDGEFCSTMQSNPLMTEMFKLLSECYDMGNKEAKIIKDRTSQTKEVKSMPVGCLFQSSPDNLIYDNDNKRKFRLEFTSKLARRSFFIYANEQLQDIQYNNIDEMLKADMEAETLCIARRHEVQGYLEELAEKLCKTKVRSLNVDNEVRRMFTLYKKYNESISERIDNRYPITRLTRAHMQWKAFKLAGALAIIQSNSIIRVKHYRAAIRYVEIISEDILTFEKQLQKENYELCADYAHMYAKNGRYAINLHTLRKMGFINSSKSVDTQMKELCRLMNSYDNSGIYEVDGDSVMYKKINKTDTIIFSCLPCSGSKEERVARCAKGYEVEECKFGEIYNMLKGNYAYTPFVFKDGIRGKGNIVSGCKMVVLDIDDSEITDEECHLMLSDINHYVVRTSNPDNAYKYRVIIELDIELDINDIQWVQFIKALGKELGIKPDPLAKSQIFFSYSGRKILSVTDGQPLETKPYLNAVQDVHPLGVPNKQECAHRLENPIETFGKAFNAEDGEGRRRLIWACRYARELGCTKAYALKLLDDINAYWVKPLNEVDFNRMKEQVSRWNWIL